MKTIKVLVVTLTMDRAVVTELFPTLDMAEERADELVGNVWADRMDGDCPDDLDEAQARINAVSNFVFQVKLGETTIDAEQYEEVTSNGQAAA